MDAECCESLLAASRAVKIDNGKKARIQTQCVSRPRSFPHQQRHLLMSMAISMLMFCRPPRKSPRRSGMLFRLGCFVGSCPERPWRPQGSSWHQPSANTRRCAGPKGQRVTAIPLNQRRKHQSTTRAEEQSSVIACICVFHCVRGHTKRSWTHLLIVRGVFSHSAKADTSPCVQRCRQTESQNM